MNKALRLDYQGTVRDKGLAEKANAAPACPGRPSIASPADSLLLALMQARGTFDSDGLLARLLFEHAQPIIRSIVKSRLRVSLKPVDGSLENQDALEVCCEILADLVYALRRLQEGLGPSINNFQGYVAVITYNACHDYLRRKYPRRHGLKNRLRYLLTHHPEFSLWEIEGVMVCGLTAWRFQRRAPAVEGRLRQLFDGSDHQLDSISEESRTGQLPSLALELFRQADGPVELDELVGVVAELQGVKEEKPLAEFAREESDGVRLQELLPGGRTNPALEAERRLYLRQLWMEICRLPQGQRAALLLNLRDSPGGVGLNLLPITGVATLREVAEVLKMSAEELAALWGELPLSDAAIAERLHITRQQVINLRKSARGRLARRMKTLWWCDSHYYQGGHN